MNANGQVLTWTGRVLAEEDLRRHLNGHRQVVLSREAVITPLALEYLRQSGITWKRLEPSSGSKSTRCWGYAQERDFALVRAVVASLQREGIALFELPCDNGSCCRWARELAEWVSTGRTAGGVVLCGDPGLLCCVANKVPGVRAVPASCVSAVARAAATLGANLVAVEMPGRTFFEIRQIFRTLCHSSEGCPVEVAQVLNELEGHNHAAR